MVASNILHWRITKLQSFKSMVKFLEMNYNQTNSDDLGSLLGDLQLFPGGGTWDPAAWNDWIHSTDTVLHEKIEQKLTKLQAFNAMGNFLEGYRERTSSDDVKTLLMGMEFLSDSCTVEPTAWNNWIKCVDSVLQETGESTVA